MSLNFTKSPSTTPPRFIWGVGLHGVKCWQLLVRENIPFNGFLTNDRQVNSFCGQCVFDGTETVKKHGGKIFIIVATKAAVYLKISEQLTKLGLIEFDDYIYYEWLHKRLVLLHGNCHMEVIKAFLLSQKSFTAKYTFYPAPLIQCYENKCVDVNVLKNIDMWIHEDIRDENEFGFFLSDTYIRRHLPNHKPVLDITIPHLFGLGRAFFPQFALWNRYNPAINNGRDNAGMFPHGDCVIESCIDEGLSAEQTISHCLSDDAMEAEKICNNFSFYMDKIKQREKNWDIKIFDFISNNYRERQMFYDQGHPANTVFKEICSQLLSRLGLTENELFSDVTLDQHEEPMYPITNKILDIKWRKKNIRCSNNAKKMTAEMDFAEYIREYILWHNICINRGQA